MKNTNKNTDKKNLFLEPFYGLLIFLWVILDPSKTVRDTILPNCLVVNGFSSLQL